MLLLRFAVDGRRFDDHQQNPLGPMAFFVLLAGSSNGSDAAVTVTGCLLPLIAI